MVFCPHQPTLRRVHLLSWSKYRNTDLKLLCTFFNQLLFFRLEKHSIHLMLNRCQWNTENPPTLFMFLCLNIFCSENHQLLPLLLLNSRRIYNSFWILRYYFIGIWLFRMHHHLVFAFSYFWITGFSASVPPFLTLVIQKSVCLFPH